MAVFCLFYTGVTKGSTGEYVKITNKDNVTGTAQLTLNNRVNVVFVLFLVKCYDNKMAKSPYSLIIHPLVEPQVANQQQQHKSFNRTSFDISF